MRHSIPEQKLESTLKESAANSIAAVGLRQSVLRLERPLNRIQYPRGGDRKLVCCDKSNRKKRQNIATAIYINLASRESS